MSAESDEAIREFRMLVMHALDRLLPVIEQAVADHPGDGDECRSCPFCALSALARGNNPELVGRVSAELAQLLTLLSEAIGERPDVAGSDTNGMPAERASEPESAP